MLVVQVKFGQTVQIGKDIFVTPISPTGNGIRIGVDAPERIRIVRNEIVERYTIPGLGEESQVTIDDE